MLEKKAPIWIAQIAGGYPGRGLVLSFLKSPLGSLNLFFLMMTLVIGSEPALATDKLTYNMTLSDIEADIYDPVRTSFTAVSLLATGHKEPLVSVANLRKQIETDSKIMTKILRAEGYYNSNVTYQMTRLKNHFEIMLKVTSGPLYRIGEVHIDYQGPVPEENIRAQITALVDKNLLLAKDNPARAADVLITEAQLSEILPDLGFPFAKEIKHDIVVDHKLRIMNIHFLLETGMRQRMGTTHIHGLDSVKESYIRKLATWQKQAYYDQNLINDFHARLNKSGLFSSININVKPNGPDQADIDLKLKVTKHRTIGATLGYSTAEGIGGEISWENRNFLHRGSLLKFIVRGAEIERALSSLLEIPNFARLDQTLSFEATYRRLDTDAFFAHTINTNANLNRVITTELALHAGLDLEYSDITDAESSEDFYLAAMPIGLRYDSSDNLLDPTHGLRISFVTAPSIGRNGKKFTFLKNELRASAYYPVMDNNTVVAIRTHLGSIIGTETDTLPATRRFYAGGGGSIRGFSFQRVGPVNSENIPLGGRSIIEVAAELRWKFMSNISIVPFVEGGNVYDSALPKLKDFRWGAGLGARYHTDFGPIRLDVAFPLNRRLGDSQFQLYISLGQAF